MPAPRSVLALCLLLAACSGGDDVVSAGSISTALPATDPGPVSTSGPVTGDMSESAGSSASSGGVVDPDTTAAPTSSGETSTGTSGGSTSGGGTSSSGGGDDSTTAAPVTTCPCYAGPGPYCGHGVVDYAMTEGCEVPALAGHHKDILKCKGGEWTVDEDCPADCEPTAPGEADACNLPECACFVKEAWCGSGAAEHGLTLDPPCRVPLVPAHNDDILGCDGAEWIVKQACEKGCHEEMVGVPDSCNSSSLYKLPYKCGTKQTCSQANNGSSHQGSQEYAWDFAMTKGTPVHAARAGKIAYLEMRSPPGSQCYDPPGLLEACHNKANFIGIRHSDGTVALYMHLREMKVKLGATVTQGQLIALSGNSGYTSGPHLHFQLQNDCGIWFCSSVPVKFADAPKLAKGTVATSGNCP